MKKTLIVLAGLFVLSIATIICAGTVIDANVDEVQFEENAIFGDASEVEGVIVHRNLKWEDMMYWHTTYVVGNPQATKTDYEFYAYEKADEYEWFEEGLRFTNAAELFSLNPDIEPEDGVGKALYELFKRTPNGENSCQTFRLKDYEDYYSFGITFDTKLYYFWIEPENEDDFANDEVVKKQREVLEHFNEFFRIPVVENEICKIGVNKSENGELFGYYIYDSYYYGDYFDETSSEEYEELENAEHFTFEINSVNTEDTFYFTFYPFTSEGNPVDTSLIPGGYGIYSFKYGDQFIDGESLKLEYALEPSGYVDVELDEQQENLLIFREKENDLGEIESYLTVLDLETMEEKQTIAYGKGDDNNLSRGYWVYDDFLIAQHDYFEAAVLSRAEDGTYHFEFTIPGTSEASGDNFLFFEDTCFDWNGEKLLVAGENNNAPEGYFQEQYLFYNPLTGEQSIAYGRYRMSCGFYLSVFDKNGMSYYGEYDCNLDTDLYSQKACTITRYNRLRVTWPEDTP